MIAAVMVGYDRILFLNMVEITFIVCRIIFIQLVSNYVNLHLVI